MTAQPHESLTQAEFPAWEQRQATKHEFVDGHVFSFAGGTQAHSEIAMYLGARIVAGIVPPCRAYNADMLIQMATSSRYADVVVTCDPRDRNPDGLVLRYPRLVIEVFSDSTASEDLGPKMREYQATETLEEYVVVDSRRRWAQISRRDSATWTMEKPVHGGAITLTSVGVTIELDDVYDRAGIRPAP